MKTARWISARIERATGNDIDPNFFNFVSQMAHSGTTFFVTTVLATSSRWLFDKGWAGVIAGLAVCFAYAGWHEFVWDPVHENTVTRGDDWEDFFFLCAGASLAAAHYAFLIAR